MKKIAVLLLILSLAPAAFCNPSVRTQVERTISRASLAKGARVELKFEWKKQEYLERHVRFRPGRKIRVPYQAEHKTTQCVGVLLNNARVATASSCLKESSGFKLQKITLTFSNGKSGKTSARKASVNGDIAQIAVDPALTVGLIGMEVAEVADGRSLQDVYGKEFASALQNFLLSRGVLSPRAARLTGRKVTLQRGEPFFWKGKVVAVFNRVPRRLPVSLFGQISEDFLSVFRK